MSRPVLPSVAVDYPTSDGKPLAENDAQARAILYAFDALRVYFEARLNVYVSADLLLCYESATARSTPHGGRKRTRGGWPKRASPSSRRGSAATFRDRSLSVEVPLPQIG